MTTYIVVAFSEVQRSLILHVPKHHVGTRLAEEVGDGGVLSAHSQVQRCAAVEHGGVHVGAAAEEQLHRRHVAQFYGEVERRLPAGSLLHTKEQW